MSPSEMTLALALVELFTMVMVLPYSARRVGLLHHPLFGPHGLLIMPLLESDRTCLPWAMPLPDQTSTCLVPKRLG